MKIIAGEKLRQQAIARIREHIENEAREGAALAKIIHKRCGGIWTIRDYRQDEAQRLAKIESLNGLVDFSRERRL